jgi:hypothetical protein
MATYTADQFIGKTLRATNTIIAHYGNPTGKTTFKIYKGQNVGVVDSWIIKNTPDHKLWWQFRDSKNLIYYVPHANLELTEYDKGTMQSVEDKIKEQKEKEEKEKNSGVAYYIEKWGKRVLIGGALVYVTVQISKSLIHERGNRSTKS